MAFKAEQCRTWLEAQAPGEVFVSYLVTGTSAPANPTPNPHLQSGVDFKTDAVRDLAQRLGLDEAQKVGAFVESTFLALTDRRVLYGSRTAFRDRPKDLLHAAPVAGFTLHWIDDDSGAGNRFRHLLVDFGDGAWRIERVGLTALGRDMSHRTNVQHFFAALGDRARPIAA